MNADEFLKQGRLDDALQSLQEQVRAEPSEARHRIFLFQLMCVVGQWERAIKQLRLCGQLDPSALAMVHTYSDAVQCEVLRKQVFKGERSPLVFGEPQQWLAELSEALRLDGQGDSAAAGALRMEVFDKASGTSGRIDGEPFEWIADGDSRLGPVLEAVVRGSYYWIPFDRIALIRIEAPSDLRDLVWTPAFFTWANGGETPGLIPTRYADTADAGQDDQFRLARRTEWRQLDGDTYAGVGQRMLLTNTGEFPLLEIREITLDTAIESDDGSCTVKG